MLGLSSNGNVCGKQHKAKCKNQDKIDDQEKSASIFSTKIGKTPDISYAYRTSGSCQDKADRITEVALFLFHGYYLNSYFLLNDGH